MVAYGMGILLFIRELRHPPPASPSPGTQMMLGWETPLRESGDIWMT